MRAGTSTTTTTAGSVRYHGTLMLILMMMVMICLASAQSKDPGEPTNGQLLRERRGCTDEDEEGPLGEIVEG